MKVLYHHRTQAKGAEGNHIRGIVSALRRHGCEVDVVGPPGVSLDEDFARTSDESPPSFMASLAEYLPQIFFELLEIAYNAYAGFALWKKLRHDRYDLVYERYALFGFAGALVAKHFGVPIFLEVNDAVVIERSRPLILRRLARFIERRVLACTSKVYTITEYFRSLLCNAYSLNREHVRVTPNAIDPERFKKRALPTHKVDGNLEGKTVLGLTGAFVHWHGLEFLIEAIRDLLRAEDLHVLVVGDGPACKNAVALAKEYGVGDRLTITGFLPSHEVPLHLDSADIYVIPGSNPHCSPVKLFEYMAMGKPIIACDYPPIRSVLEDGVDGLLFPPHDGAALRVAIQRVLQDRSLAERLGKNAKRKVFAQFTWDNNADVIMSDLEGRRRYTPKALTGFHPTGG